jgi:hypothetical protein
MSVFIEGDKSMFLSKTAIDRFKKIAKETKHDAIDSSKYLKEGYTFTFTTKDNNTTATIISTEQIKLDEKRKLLRDRLNNAKRVRGGEQWKQLDSLKRTVPEKIFKSYHNLIKTYAMPNIPSPDEVINNVERYRQQISMVMGLKTPVSNEIRANNAIKNYFNALGEFLGIEPTEMDLNSIMNSTQMTSNTEHINNSDTEEED